VADQHYRRTREVVRVGGLGVGGWRLGGHRYSVGPLSVADASALLGIITQLAGLWPKDAAGAMSFARAAPIAVLRPLVPMLVEGRTKRGVVTPGALMERDRRRMTPEQVMAVFTAAMNVNDLDFIFASFGSNSSAGEMLSLERMVDRFVLRYRCYTHADAWAMPAQEFLAIVETWRIETEQEGEDGEGKDDRGMKQLPITKDDLAMMRFVRWVN
jgi:hypothetical protein